MPSANFRRCHFYAYPHWVVPEGFRFCRAILSNLPSKRNALCRYGNREKEKKGGYVVKNGKIP